MIRKVAICQTSRSQNGVWAPSGAKMGPGKQKNSPTLNLVNPPLEFYKNGTVTFDLSDSTKAYFNFKYAFARKNSTNNDYLKVLASNDCGKTWSVRKILRYSQLITAPDQNNFLPLSNFLFDDLIFLMN